MPTSSQAPRNRPPRSASTPRAPEGPVARTSQQKDIKEHCGRQGAVEGAAKGGGKASGCVPDAANAAPWTRCGRRRQGYPTCLAPAPREERITADIRNHLARLALPEPLVRWTLEAIDWWANEQKLGLRDLANGRTAELDKTRGRIKRLTDLAVAGAIAEDEFVRRRGALQLRADSLERDANNPLADLERWKQTVLDALEVGAGALKAFDLSPLHQRRDLLGRLYVNLLVTERNTAPVLHFPFVVLENAHIPTVTDSGGDVNLPPPRDAWLNGRKNARPRDARLRELSLWCALRDEVLTAVWQDLDLLLGVGSSVQALGGF